MSGRRLLATSSVLLVASLLPIQAACTLPSDVARYPLEIEAPQPLVALLRAHTLLGRWQYRMDFEASQMPLFKARAPEEIRALLASQGYFTARIQVSPQEDGVRITVDPGARSRVRELSLQVDDPDPQTAARLQRELLVRWPLQTGQAFVSEEWTLAKRRLIEALRDDGFLRARIDHSEVEVDPERAVADLRLRVVPGPALRYGRLQIRGLSRYPPAVIDGLKPFRIGDEVDARQLALMQSRLAGAGWFSTAHVRADLEALSIDPDRTDVPILVDVVEHPARRLSLVLGLDTDHGLGAEGQWEHYNHWGAGVRSMLGAHVDQDRQTVFSTWESPQGSGGWRWQGGVRLEARDIRNDVVQSGQVFVARLQRDGAIERGWSVSWQDEVQSIGLAPGIEQRDRHSAWVVGWSWSLRDLDSPVFPTRGQVLNLQVSAAHEGLGSERSFMRGYASVARLIPVLNVAGRERARLLLRAELGHVQAASRDGIPSANLFRTGGGQSVRGYAAQSLGLALGEATVGGRMMAVGSVEWQQAIDEHWAWAVFADLGDVADRWANWRAHWGLGSGLRWRTPIGPLKIDLARGLQGGRWRLYTSLGVVF
ncbi:MAG: autotransporter assembly complex protein TamA [Burkholderiales bacterium]